MRKMIVAGAMSAALLAVPAGAFAGNPSPTGTGLPSQSCQDVVAAGGSLPSTQSGLSPGSPFNEPTDTNPGGIGGQNYNETSQYDVACYQVTAHH
jgi:hypothetical protein